MRENVSIEFQVERAAVGSVLVVGAGIAGIQASLDLADSGFQVHLLESSPAIGGTMAQLDKTFPTNDCSMCILSPKVVECARHHNIHLMTWSELESLEGEAGRFRARIRHKPRLVNADLCTGCSECTGVCPVEVPNSLTRGWPCGRPSIVPSLRPCPTSLPLTRGHIAVQGGLPRRYNAQGYVALIAAGRYAEGARAEPQGESL